MAVLQYERTCRTRWCVAIHLLELGLGLQWSRGKQGRRGRLTLLNVPLLLSTSCWEFFGHLILLSCTHVIEEGNGVLIIISLWSPPCCVPTSLNEGRGDDVAATWQLYGGLWCYDVANHPTAARLEPLTWGPSMNMASHEHMSLSTERGKVGGGWQ